MNLKNKNVVDYLLQLGDDRLILGHRLSEWCGHAPILEEDIALANIAQDCLGQATFFLNAAAEEIGNGKTTDDLAYLRNPNQFKNLLIMELPKGDFAFTIFRQFLVDNYTFLLYQQLQNSKHNQIANIAQKSLKEVKYHLRHSSEWVLRLGDGTEISHEKSQNALNELWAYTNELFNENEIEKKLAEENIAIESFKLKNEWLDKVTQHLKTATLKILENKEENIFNGRSGKHTEHLDHLLSEMQIVVRAYPGAKW
ncbi:MAG: phenylacetate-CoA oxygenase subunit PaaC [Bacteroidetes bacterium]|nr:phenylacetate-CoA oxygenase subunit PaaC [Bacteroidota bacterium]